MYDNPISSYFRPLNSILCFIGILATRLVIAALYKYLGEPMKLMWNESLKINTIHVDDVVAAAVYLAQSQQANRQCYNLVDDSQSTQGSISSILANIFNIKIDYWGEGLSNLSKVYTHICSTKIAHHSALLEPLFNAKRKIHFFHSNLLS